MKKIQKILLIILPFFMIADINAQTNTTNNTSGGTPNKSGVFIGLDAGKINDANYNTFVGYESGIDNTVGIANTFIGFRSGWKNLGADNTFVGASSGVNNTNGKRNTFIGRKSGYYNTTGNYNVFNGYESGLNNTDGSGNSFMGYWSGLENTTGEYNSFIGQASGRHNTSGSYNTFMGFQSGNQNETGSNNVMIGKYAGRNSLGSNNVLIGNHAGENIIGNDKLAIDNENTITPLIYGDFANDQLIFNGKVGIGIETIDFSTNVIPSSSNIDYKFFVNGGILAKEVRVNTGWADYVFKDNYELKTLNTVEQYINKEGHLPNMPSEQEVLDNGIDVGDMTRMQQEKIEELTLYTINQQKQIDELKKLILEIKSAKTD